MPEGKKEALKKELDNFERFITKQKQINESLKNYGINIENENLWNDITGLNEGLKKEGLKKNWLATDTLGNLTILVRNEPKSGSKCLSLTIADAKETIKKISSTDRIKAYAVGIVDCIKVNFLDGITYVSEKKQWEEILNDLKDDIKKLNEIQSNLLNNVEKLKPGFISSLVSGAKNLFASSTEWVRDIKCQDGETVYKKLELIIEQKNKLLDCGDKGKGAIEAQIKWRNGKQEMSDSQKEFWLNKGNSALLENLGKLKFEESNNIENFLKELKEIAGYNDNVHDKVDVSNQESVGNVIINCLVHMSDDLKEAKRKWQEEEERKEEEEELKEYGTFYKETKTFKFNESVTKITADIAKSLPDDVENLVGDSVQTIGYDAFSGCKKLKTAEFKAAKTIEMFAFCGCIALEKAEFNAVTTIGISAFSGCEKLKTATFKAATTIGEKAFAGCAALKKAEFNAVTTIGNYAFSKCAALTTANFESNEVTIGEKAFANCTALTTANIPNATTIGYGAFLNCITLETAKFNAATTIGNIAFYDCKNLTTANIPNATTIGDNAFANCIALTTVNIPNATTIGESAFYKCSALTTVNIPNATIIGRYAFDGCPILERLKKEEEERLKKEEEERLKKEEEERLKKEEEEKEKEEVEKEELEKATTKEKEKEEVEKEEEEGDDYSEAFFTECEERKARKDSWKRTITHAPKRAVRTVKNTFKSVFNKIRGKEEKNNEEKIKNAFQKVGKYFVTDTASDKKLFSRKEMKHRIGEDVKKICPVWYDILAISLKDNMLKQVKLSGPSAWLYGYGTADEKDKVKLAKIKKAKSLAILLISLRGLCDEQGNCYAGAAIEGLKSGGFNSSLQSSEDLCKRVAANILNTSGDIDKSTGKLKDNNMGKIKTIIDPSSVKLVSTKFDGLVAKARDEAEKMANSDFSDDL